MLVSMREFQGRNTAVTLGLNVLQKSLSAPDLIHIDGEQVLLLGDLGHPLLATHDLTSGLASGCGKGLCMER